MGNAIENVIRNENRIGNGSVYISLIAAKNVIHILFWYPNRSLAYVRCPYSVRVQNNMWTDFVFHSIRQSNIENPIN